MKYSVLFLAIFFSTEVISAQTDAVATMQQHLSSVEYSSSGRQTGCGLRITGVAKNDLSLNVLITVFMKEAGNSFGVIKVVARKIDIQDGVPKIQDGKTTYSSLGKIRQAWIKPDSGKQPHIYQNGKSSHNDAYMVTAEFSSTMDLLVAISQENFSVGLSRSEAGSDEIFLFDQRISQSEAGKLSVCMKNLRIEIEDNKHNKTF